MQLLWSKISVERGELDWWLVGGDITQWDYVMATYGDMLIRGSRLDYGVHME